MCFLDVRVWVLLAAREDVDSRADPIRIKATSIKRTKACIVGRNSTSAFEGKHRVASTSAYLNN